MFTQNKGAKRLGLTKIAKTLAFTSACLCLHAQAHAQTASPYVTTTKAVDVNVPSITEKLGNWLTDSGITPTLLYSGQMASNVLGGQRQGTAYAGRLSFGAAFDMDKILGIPGGTLHVIFADDTGQNLSAHYVNSDLSNQSLFSGPEAFQLAIFTYEQKLFDDKVDINVGRTDLAFLNSDLYCDFESRADCGRPAATFKTIAAPLFPTAVWGGRILYAPTPHFYGKIGIYQPNPDLRPGWSGGFDWGIKTSGPAGGYDLPVEVGYTYTTPGASIQNQYDVGVIDSQEQFSAPWDTAKQPEHAGRVDIYVQAQQMVYQAEPNKPRGIYMFGYAIYGASGQSQVANYQLTAGAVWEGPFASRPRDRAGAQFTTYHMNDLYLDYLYANRLKENGSGRPWSSQNLIEVNYNAQVTPWLQLEPDFQYLIHPDGLGFSPYPKTNLKNAFVVGLQFNINFATLIGLPSYSLAAQQDN
jgi:porin